MRLFILVFFALLFSVTKSSGQKISSYETGSYIVAGAPFVHVPGKLKTKSNHLLLVKTPQGKKLQFFPEQIISFRVGTRKFVVVDEFKIGSETAPRGFAEIIDSGQVFLMRYLFTSDAPPVVTSSKFGATGSSPKPYYLLCKPNGYQSPTVLIDDSFYGIRRIFNRTLLPFVPSQRPDLIKIVKQNTVTPRNIKAFIHALNTGQPFN